MWNPCNGQSSILCTGAIRTPLSASSHHVFLVFNVMRVCAEPSPRSRRHYITQNSPQILITRLQFAILNESFSSELPFRSPFRAATVQDSSWQWGIWRCLVVHDHPEPASLSARPFCLTFCIHARHQDSDFHLPWTLSTGVSTSKTKCWLRPAFTHPTTRDSKNASDPFRVPSF